ncbi:hypothetical protein EV561_14323 [Rhizobium sp. BK376]|nr:hypothetical protein EV561_14323 [Rhizobium sp. BK376]
MSDSIARALRIDRSALESMHDQKHGNGVFPVTAKMDSGETFKGSTINSKKKGRHFSLQSSRRSTTCSGDSDSPKPMSTFQIKCSDGRTGNAIITIASDNMSATGKVTLSDGSKGRVIVGQPR